MSARKSYADYVNEDLDAIDIRAITLYALTDPAVPWPTASDLIRDPFKTRAAQELWEEGALHLNPSQPYYDDPE